MNEATSPWANALTDICGGSAFSDDRARKPNAPIISEGAPLGRASDVEPYEEGLCARYRGYRSRNRNQCVFGKLVSSVLIGSSQLHLFAPRPKALIVCYLDARTRRASKAYRIHHSRAMRVIRKRNPARLSMRTPLSPRALLCKGGLADEGLPACSHRVCLPSAWSLFLLSGRSRGEYTLGTVSCHCRTSRVVSDQRTEDVPPARKACAKRCIQLTRTHSFDQIRPDALSRSRVSANRELIPSYEEAFPRSWRHSIFPGHVFRSPSLMVTVTPARPGDRLI